MAMSPFELLWELVVLTLVEVGTGVRVELKREDDDKMLLLLLLLSGRPDEELGGAEERSEGEDPDGELPLLTETSVPVPQGMFSPFGWVFSGGGVLFPFSSVMVNLVVQYF